MSSVCVDRGHKTWWYTPVARAFLLSQLLTLPSSVNFIASLLMDDRTAYGAFAAERPCKRCVRKMPFLRKDASWCNEVAFSIRCVLLTAPSRVQCDARVGSWHFPAWSYIRQARQVLTVLVCSCLRHQVWLVCQGSFQVPPDIFCSCRATRLIRHRSRISDQNNDARYSSSVLMQYSP